MIILCSGVALGVYVPGLMLRRDLRALGVPADVCVLEELLPEDKRATVVRSRSVFHQSFRMAVAAHRMARDMTPLLDERAVTALLQQWRQEERRAFVVLSGFWLPLIERHADSVSFPLDVELLHIDSVDSPSFLVNAALARRWRHRRLLDAEAGQVSWALGSSHEPPVPFARRERRFLAHGGGWGMGTYAERAAELLARELSLDVVLHEREELARRVPGGRYFMIDPAWHPWVRGTRGEHTFPPFGEVSPEGEVSFQTPTLHHDSFALARTSVAMISKPGGGTMLDSLSAATPVVLLEPLGAHEQRNAELWERLGFGIGYERWRQSGHSLELLESMHHRLVAARDTVGDVAASLAAELGR